VIVRHVQVTGSGPAAIPTPARGYAQRFSSFRRAPRPPNRRCRPVVMPRSVRCACFHPILSGGKTLFSASVTSSAWAATH